MDTGLSLPWWEFTPSSLAIPGSVVQSKEQEEREAALVARFLQSGARAETAERFISGTVHMHLLFVQTGDAATKQQLVYRATELHVMISSWYS